MKNLPKIVTKKQRKENKRKEGRNQEMSSVGGAPSSQSFALKKKSDWLDICLPQSVYGLEGK